MLRMILGAILALAIISPGLTADLTPRSGKKPATTRSASIAGPRMVTISCPVTAEFFKLEPREACNGTPARTYWVELVGLDGSPVDGQLIAAMSGKPANITCTIGSTASDSKAFAWQQSPGGFYRGTSHDSGKSTAVFVNPLAALSVMSGKVSWVSATCILTSTGLAGFPFDIRNVALHFD